MPIRILKQEKYSKKSIARRNGIWNSVLGMQSQYSKDEDKIKYKRIY